MIKRTYFGFFFLLAAFTFGQPCNVSVSATSNSVCPGFQSTLTAFGASSYTWFTTSGVVMSQSIAGGAGTYSVTGSSGTCISGTTFTIGSAPPLSITVTPAATVTCITSNNPKYSNPITFSASGAGSYVWAPYNSAEMSYSLGPVTTVRPPATTCYTVTGFTSVCSGSAVACVTVLPQYSISVTPPQSTICAGDALSMSVTMVGSPPPGYTYSWSETAGPTLSSPLSPSTVATPSVDQTYTVEVWNTGKCVSIPQLVNVYVEACVGQTDLSSPAVKVFPNPSDGAVHVHSDKNIRAISLYDLRGCGIDVPLVLVGGNAAVFLEQLPPGFYFLWVEFADGTSTTVKIIRN